MEIWMDVKGVEKKPYKKQASRKVELCDLWKYWACDNEEWGKILIYGQYIWNSILCWSISLLNELLERPYVPCSQQAFTRDMDPPLGGTYSLKPSHDCMPLQKNPNKPKQSSFRLNSEILTEKTIAKSEPE